MNLRHCKPAPTLFSAFFLMADQGLLNYYRTQWIVLLVDLRQNLHLGETLGSLSEGLSSLADIQEPMEFDSDVAKADLVAILMLQLVHEYAWEVQVDQDMLGYHLPGAPKNGAF